MAQATTDFGLSQIGQISVTAHDLERAVAFYRDVLGVKLLFEVPPRMAFFDCSGIRLLLGLPEPDHDHPGSILYFKVADIRQAHARLRNRGVDFLQEPHLVARMPDHELWMAFFKDSEDNTLALMSEVRGS
jgi:methylmalonyl-CoA/ethylmalonyl-CoA epimerase